MRSAARLVLALALLTPASSWAATNVSADLQRYRHTCTYPAAAVHNNLEGNTIVAVNIDEKGKTSRAFVEQSSGSAVLDDAAKACVLAWNFPSNNRNGRDTRKEFRIIWHLTDATPVSQPAPPLAPAKLNGPKPQSLSFEQPLALPQGVTSQGDHTCSRWYPSQSIREGKQGVTGLAFTIAADGTVKDIDIMQSSGDERLDQVSIICASFWRYRVTGPKQETAWRTDIAWKLTQ